jgi:hypothetical protein
LNNRFVFFAKFRGECELWTPCRLLITNRPAFLSNAREKLMKSKKLSLFIVLAFSLCCAALTAPAAQNTRRTNQNGSGEDVILRWNRVLGQTIPVSNSQPPTVNPVRSFAMMHLAMFDAVNSIDGRYAPYLTNVPGTRHASIEAAAAQAAHDVLTALYPDQQAMFDAELADSLVGIPANRARQGIRVGRRVAEAMLANRANDGWSAPWTPYLLKPEPGNWQELFPGPYPGFAVFTNYPGVTPFALTSATQFLPPPPRFVERGIRRRFERSQRVRLGNEPDAHRRPDFDRVSLVNSAAQRRGNIQRRPHDGD